MIVPLPLPKSSRHGANNSCFPIHGGHHAQVSGGATWPQDQTTTTTSITSYNTSPIPGGGEDVDVTWSSGSMVDYHSGPGPDPDPDGYHFLSWPPTTAYEGKEVSGASGRVDRGGTAGGYQLPGSSLIKTRKRWFGKLGRGAKGRGGGLTSMGHIRVAGRFCLSCLRTYLRRYILLFTCGIVG